MLCKRPFGCDKNARPFLHKRLSLPALTCDLGDVRANALKPERHRAQTPMLLVPVRLPPTKISSLSGKDAAPDIQIFKQAKAEYARLQ